MGFKEESRKFAQACRKEHEALGALLEATKGMDLPKGGPDEAWRLAHLAHISVDQQLGVTVVARAKKGKTVGEARAKAIADVEAARAGHPTTDDDMSRATLGRDAHQAD
jgi:hypothetical protein